MKNIKYILIFAVLIASGKLFAQQDPSYTLYKYNMNIINPAYAGTNGHTELNLNIRSQWIGLKGSPETQSLSFAKSINDKVGIGFTVVNDQVDIIKETDFTVDFSYRVQVSETSDLFLGVKAGGYSLRADLQSKAQNDPAFGENVSRFNAIFGAGAYLKVKKFYATLFFQMTNYWLHAGCIPEIFSKYFQKTSVIIMGADGVRAFRPHLKGLSPLCKIMGSGLRPTPKRG